MPVGSSWRNHPLVGTIILGIIFMAVSFFATLLYDVVLNSTEMLQSIIQADATILGFFGIIVAYMLASYDSRLDRFEQQYFDLSLGGYRPRAEVTLKKINVIKTKKKRAALGFGAASGFIIFSLLSSIFTLGYKNANLRIAEGLTLANLNCLFIGFVAVVFLFYQMSYEAEEIY